MQVIDPDGAGREVVGLDEEATRLELLSGDGYGLETRVGDPGGDLSTLAGDDDGHGAAGPFREEVVVVSDTLVEDYGAVAGQVLAHLLAGGGEDRRAEAVSGGREADESSER